MFDQNQENHLTVRQLLIPVAALALTMTLLLAFQTQQILRERDALHEAMGQQQKPFEDSQRLQAQLTALVTGTEKLSQQGNVSAKEIEERLKKLGVSSVPPQEQAAPPPAPVPAAAEAPRSGPLKP